MSTSSKAIPQVVPARARHHRGKRRQAFWAVLFLAPALMALVILRVASVRGCDYEFEHHVRLGKRAGVTAADVERVRAGSTADGWSDHERLLLAVTEELLGTRDLGDTTWAELRAAYDERRVIELLLLVGHYDMLATTINTLRVEPDH